jgi:methylenetetrahydrofolate dehydrogenase (NADP+)/methenyltetrahydrofolate cyclohydrolase
MILLEGKKVADKLYDLLGTDNKKAKLVVLTFGDDPASAVYVRNKKRACERVGVEFEQYRFTDNIGRKNFVKFINGIIEQNVYNGKYTKFGIILQLPAPEEYVKLFNSTNVIPPYFDVDGFGDKNFEALMVGKTPYNYPATPKGIMTLLNNYNIDVEGKHVVIIGRSNIVGKPLAQMMLSKNATVTICHSKTQNLEQITKTADILVAAIGKPKFINETHIKDNVIIVDVGINKTEEGLCGDVDFDRVKDKCYAITPVPGGVGPMTVYTLVENILQQ